MMSSFGRALEAGAAAVPPADAQRYGGVLVTAAASLAARYSPKLGLFRSWGSNLQDREFKVGQPRGAAGGRRVGHRQGPCASLPFLSF